MRVCEWMYVYDSPCVSVLYSYVVFGPVAWLQVLIANLTQLYTDIPPLHALSGKFIGTTGSIP